MYGSTHLERRIIFRVPDELVKRFDEALRAKVKRSGRTWPPLNRSTVVRGLIEEWIADNKPKPAAKKRTAARAKAKRRPAKGTKARRTGKKRRTVSNGR